MLKTFLRVCLQAHRSGEYTWTSPHEASIRPFPFSTCKMGRGQRIVYRVRMQFFEVDLFLGRHSCPQQPRP